ncbi:MAG: ABC transporter permease [Myxococcales bacterium]|nr:ABC transporter permease [Myxococcales bacterium]
MKALWLLARLRLKEMIHSPATAALYLGMPLALLVIVATVFADGHPFERKTLAVVGRAAAPSGTWELLAGLPGLRLREDASLDAAIARLHTRAASGVLIFDPSPRLLVGPRDNLFGRGLVTLLPGPPRLEIVPLHRWGYVHFIFPGMLAITVIAGGLFGMGYAMARYRNNQFLKKLATTPLSRSTFVAAQIGSRAALVLLQVALLGIAGRFLFDLPLGPVGAAWLALLTLLGLLCFLGVGFALACFVRDESNLLDLINVLIMPLVFLSEIFFPVDALPAPLALFARALPSTELVRLTRAVLLYGETSPAALLPGLAILCAWTLATFTVAVASFKWHDR